ncbi:MAG: phage portal protein [Gluconacetobacter liquefaciens]
MSMRSRLKSMLYKSASAIAYAVTGVSLTDLRLGAFLAGGSSYAGKTVTVDTAMQLDTVWACVRLLSEIIATLPLNLYRQQGNGKAVLARDHPLFRILHDMPNADMTAMEFWSCMMASLLLWGNAYGQIERRGDGAIVAINPLRPDRMTVRRDQASGSLIYTYSWQQQVLVIDEADIFHVKGFSLDGIMGISPISAARHSLGTAIAAEETAGRMYANGMLSQSYIKSPDWLDDAQVVRAKEILKDYSGALNAGKTPLLEGGWTVESIGLNPSDLQLLQARGFNVETICRWFGVQPVMIGRMEKSTAWGSGLEQMNLWFLTYALQPWLVRIEQAIWRCLLSAVEKQTLYAKHNVKALLRADSTARAQLNASEATNGIRTRNEIRADDDLPPLSGGDVLTVQAQMIPLVDVGKAAVQPTLKPVPGGPPQQTPQPAGIGGPDDD